MADKIKIDKDKIKIRLGILSDLEGILSLSQKLFEYETPWNKGTFNMGWTYSSAGRKYFIRWLTKPKDLVVVAEYRGKIVGYLSGGIYSHSWRTVNPMAEIYNMFIEKNFRNLGLGKKLIREAVEKWKSQKVRFLRVSSHPANKQALIFYKKNGFDDAILTLEQPITNFPN